MTLASFLYHTTPKRVEAVRVTPELLREGDNLRELTDWIQEGGRYPWLKGNATEPHKLEPRESEGIYIEPSMGDLMLRNRLGGGESWFFEDLSIMVNAYVVKHEGGKVVFMNWRAFNEMYTANNPRMVGPIL